MDDGAERQPDEDPQRVGAVDELQQRPRDERQRHEVRDQVQRGCAVAGPHANSIEETHFVLCTPGSAGTMIRAG